MRFTRAECASRYGAIIEGKDSAGNKFLYWPDEAKHCVMIMIPAPICFVVKNSMTGRRWSRLYCNRDMAKPLLSALDSVVKRELISELKTFDGCYNVRMTRGSNTLVSAHSFAAAIDFNAILNPLGGRSAWSPEFVECFTEQGFTWGGSYWRQDPMHFSWVGF